MRTSQIKRPAALGLEIGIGQDHDPAGGRSRKYLRHRGGAESPAGREAHCRRVREAIHQSELRVKLAHRFEAAELLIIEPPPERNSHGPGKADFILKVDSPTPSGMPAKDRIRIHVFETSGEPHNQRMIWREPVVPLQFSRDIIQEGIDSRTIIPARDIVIPPGPEPTEPGRTEELIGEEIPVTAAQIPADGIDRL